MKFSHFIIVLLVFETACENEMEADVDASYDDQDGGKSKNGNANLRNIHNYSSSLRQDKTNDSQNIKKHSVDSNVVASNSPGNTQYKPVLSLDTVDSQVSNNIDRLGSSELPFGGFDDFVPFDTNPPYWEKSGKEIYYDESGGNVGIGLDDPAARLHVRTSDTNAFLDTSYATAIIEGTEGRLQLVANDGGSHGSTLVLSNYFSSNHTRNWIISHQTVGNDEGALSFRHGVTDSNGDTMSGSEALLTMNKCIDHETIHIARGDGLCYDFPAKWWAGIEIDNELGSNADGGEMETILKTDDISGFIWSPYLVEDGQFGLYWATDDASKWNSDDNSSNPNELVFVGYGEKKASIGLGSGKAHFKKVTTSELIVKSDYWADFVFDDDYELTPLETVESYVEENKHLPGVPSQNEIVENGVSVAKNQAILLQKIEELTLHLIAQNKEINKLKKLVDTKNR